MLTKSDLSQIGKVVEKQIDSQVRPIVRDVVGEEIQKALKPVKRDLRKIKKDLEFAVGTLDRERWHLEKRFDSHITHPPVTA